jgi:hypothetical protein
MLALVIALSLAQTSPAIRRTTPASDDPGMVVRQVGTLPVNCTNCGTTVASDGGFLGSVAQGPGADGGAWQVYVINPSGGGSGGTVVQGVGIDGGAYWSVNGTVQVTSTTGLTDAQLRATPVPVSGTVTASNASVSTTGTAPPGSATLSGGSVTTTAPSYTTGQMNALSLTTAGALRTDSSGTTQPVSGTVNQGVGQDGGAWNVSVNNGINNPLYVFILDGGTGGGGSGGTVNQGVGQDGGLWGVSVVSTNIIDTNNSSTTPLGAGATFTGTGTDVTSFSQVAVFVYSDRASATDGFKVQFSADNVNWYDSQNHTLTAAVVFPINFPVVSKFARVVFINGALAQTTFTLQTILKPIPANGTVTTLGNVPTALDQGLITQSLIFGETTGGGGGYRSVKVNPSGALTVAASQGTSPWVVSAASLPLPTGAATEATLVKLPLAQGSATAGQSGALVQGAVTTAAPAYTTGQTSPLSLTTAGDLRTLPLYTGSTGAAVPATAGTMGASDGTRLRIPKVFDYDTSGGAPDYVLGAGIRVAGFGVSREVTGIADTVGDVALAVWPMTKRDTAVTTTSVSCATTATAAPFTTNRTTQTFYNNSTVTIFLGGSSVTTGNGLPLLPGASFTDDIIDATYYCIVASGTADLRTLEQ